MPSLYRPICHVPFLHNRLVHKKLGSCPSSSCLPTRFYFLTEPCLLLLTFSHPKISCRNPKNTRLEASRSCFHALITHHKYLEPSKIWTKLPSRLIQILCSHAINHLSTPLDTTHENLSIYSMYLIKIKRNCLMLSKTE